MNKRIAIMQFPGSNCEYETQDALKKAGLNSSMITWKCEKKDFEKFDAYILPGGFSFQDRVRAGVIASKLPIIQYLSQEASKGKVVLGICNGCQILVEAGLMPKNNENQVQIGMGRNHDNGEGKGFICDWVFVRIKNPKKSLFTQYFSEDEVLPIQINHGEGSFVIKKESLDTINNETLIQYVDHQGVQVNAFPINPNGSILNLAGITTNKGRICAMMPHPERAISVKQIPTWIKSPWADKKKRNSKNINTQELWLKLFKGIKDGL